MWTADLQLQLLRPRSVVSVGEVGVKRCLRFTRKIDLAAEEPKLIGVKNAHQIVKKQEATACQRMFDPQRQNDKTLVLRCRCR